MSYNMTSYVIMKRVWHLKSWRQMSWFHMSWHHFSCCQRSCHHMSWCHMSWCYRSWCHRDQRDWVDSLETEIFLHWVSILRPRPRLFSCSLNYKSETETFFQSLNFETEIETFFSSLKIETGTETAISLKIETETFSRFLYTFGITSLEFQASSKWAI